MIKSVREQAMDLLARREHSYHELYTKLSQKGFESDKIEAALEQLQSENLLSDTRFSEAYTQHRSKAGFGPLRIIGELKERGVDEKLIDAAIWHQGIDWDKQLHQVCKKKYNSAEPFGSKGYAAQLHFLTQRGFSQEAIHHLLQNLTVEQ